MAAFVLYTDDYVIAGILPELARDLDVTEAHAGQLVTVFSLTVAVAAPVAAVILARVPRRTLFTIGLLGFVTANAAAAFVPTYAMLMALRVLAALAAASMTPALFAFAAQHAPADRTGRYIAVVSLGVTGSIAAGVPLGTWLGGQVGWRATFAAMAVAGVLALVSLLLTLPRGDAPAPPVSLAEQLRTLRSGPISVGLVANTALMTGSMMMLTYLAPYLGETTTSDVQARAVAFGLAGAAGVVGIWLGGSASDLWGPDRTLTIGIASITVSMLGLWMLWLVRPAPLAWVLVVSTLWGAMAFWNSPAISARLYLLAGPVAPQALALNTSGTYLGVALGGAVGGVALATYGPGSLPVVAAAVALGALALMTVASRLAAASSAPAG